MALGANTAHGIYWEVLLIWKQQQNMLYYSGVDNIVIQSTNGIILT